MTMRSALCLAAITLTFGCGKTVPPASGPTRPAGLYAEPARLAYTCVTPGCDESATTQITVSGDRRVAIKRILLSGTAASDFSFTSTEKPPFIVGSASSFEIEVKYTPLGAPLPGVAELRVTFTDASATESSDRLEPGELVVPLVRRLVGSPELTITPATLSFGVVDKGTSKTLPMKVSNTGFGNVVLELTGIDAGSAPLTAVFPTPHSLASDSGVDVPVTWAPTSEGYLSAQIEVEVASPGVLPGLVNVEGTSLSQPRLKLEPAEMIDFGEVSKGSSRTVPLVLLNQGGLGLVVDRMSGTDTTGNLRVSGADGGALPLDGGPAISIAPLARFPVALSLKGTTPGELDARVTFISNEPGSGARSVQLRGTVTDPKATPSPVMIDFGTVPIGWVVNKTIEVRNTGFGTLTVKNLGFVAGSSSVFALVGKPALPVQIKREQRIAFDVQLTAASAATFAGFVSIESDDAANPFTEVPLTAKVGTCAAGCPIANGTPSCSMGACSVGACNAGYFDTDKAAANGCECKEVGTDPGEFCADATYMGNLKDNDHVQTNFTGIVPSGGDVDMIRFFAEDAFALFSETFRVKVRLSSSDPGINFCVYRNDSSSHQSDCFFMNEVCPSNRYFEKGGSDVSGDDADFVVKVFRTASSTPTCTPYTVFMSNGL
jgi:hypothetical protein